MKSMWDNKNMVTAEYRACIELKRNMHKPSGFKIKPLERIAPKVLDKDPHQTHLNHKCTEKCKIITRRNS